MLLLLPLSALFQLKLRLRLRLPKLFLSLLTARTQVHLLLLKDLRLTNLFLLLTDLLLLSLLLLADLLQLLLPTLPRFRLLLTNLFLFRLLLLLSGILALLTLLSPGFFLFLIIRLTIRPVASTLPLRVRFAAHTEQQSTEKGGRNTESTK